MTQREAIEKALQMLGGRAMLQEIYPLAIEFGNFSGSKDKEATIRNCLQTSPKFFRRSPDKPAGWWELLSYQEEVAGLKACIEELKAKNMELIAIETADAFVSQLVEATKTMFATKRNDAKFIQQVLFALNRMDEQQDLMEWIVGKPSKVIKKSITKKIIQKNINSQVFNGDITESEFNGSSNNGE